jgi:DSF synthase
MTEVTQAKLSMDAHENLRLFRDCDGDVLYMSMNVRPRPCISWSCARDVVAFQKELREPGFLDRAPRCLVWSSETPDIFSLGGDLDLFRSVIVSGDRDALSRYAENCALGLHNHITTPGMVTVSLLEGDALGAGLECAMASDVVIAERGRRAGFPEMLFNLVPGHGAFHMLARRVGMGLADRLIREGNVHTTDYLHSIGAVDVLVDQGEGRRAVRELVMGNAKRWNAFQALHHIRRNYQPVTFESLMASAQIWVDAAMNLGDRNLRMMEKLVRAQQRRLGAVADTVVSAGHRVCNVSVEAGLSAA